MSLRIREARLEDLDVVQALYAQLHPADPVPADGSDRAAFEAILATSGLHLLLLERDGAVVGTTYLNVIPNLTRGAAPYALVENVVIDQTVRGQGLGRELMAATLERAWRAGCYKVMLLTGSRDPATQGFYRACGFSGDAKTAYLARPPG